MGVNKEKAIEISIKNMKSYHIMADDGCWYDVVSNSECYDSAFEMAEYKDDQFKEQKDLIKMSLKDEIFPYIMPSKRDKIGSIIDRIFDVNLDE